jgi:hypothetical protein
LHRVNHDAHGRAIVGLKALGHAELRHYVYSGRRIKPPLSSVMGTTKLTLLDSAARDIGTRRLEERCAAEIFAER